MNKNAFTRVLCFVLAAVLVLGLCVSGIIALVAGAATYRVEAKDSYVNPFGSGSTYISTPKLLAAKGTTPEFVARDVALQQVRDKINARETSVTVYYTTDEVITTNEELKAAGAKFFKDVCAHNGVPTEGDYLFWHIHGYSVGYYAEGDSSGMKVTIQYLFDYYDTAAQEADVSDAVSRVLGSFDFTGKTEYEKARMIYTWIINNVTYSKTGVDDSLNYSAYGAAVRKSCVCQGYSLLLYRLALSAGLDCRLIEGTSMGQNHGWNIVKIDGLWYNLDATWDANAVTYNYFLKGAPAFSKDHKRSDEKSSAAFNLAYPTSEFDYAPSDQSVAVYKDGVTVGYFSTVQDAVNACGAIASEANSGYAVQLREAKTENITAGQDLCLDLNGYTFTGNIAMADGAAFCGMDSATNDYDAADAGRLVGTVTGTVCPGFRIQKSLDSAKKAMRYAALKEDDGYTFHRYYADFNSMLLKTGTMSVGFKATVVADSEVLARLDAGKAVGFDVWAETAEGIQYDSKSAALTRSQLKAGKFTYASIWVCSMQKEDSTSLNPDALASSVHAQVYLNLDGNKLYSSEKSYTLKNQLETASKMLESGMFTFTESEIAALYAVCQKYSADAMKDWAIDGILNVYDENLHHYSFDFDDFFK